MDKLLVVLKIPGVVLLELLKVLVCVESLRVVVSEHQATFSTDGSFTHLTRKDVSDAGHEKHTYGINITHKSVFL